MEKIRFSNGVEMPMEGVGVFKVPEPETARVVKDALDCGYRMIDTAVAYGNEHGVGEGIRSSGVDRDDVFVTSKVWVQDASYEGAMAAVDRTLSRLGTEYVDLMLLHQPMGDYYAAWRGLEKCLEKGKVRAIGVANFYPHVLADFCLTVDMPPMLNQVEIHPFFQQGRSIEVMKEFGVAPQAWGSFAEGGHGLFTDPVLKAIGDEHGKSAAQVALRWSIQRGVSVIPKSVHKERMAENLDIWDFRLSDEEMGLISKLDTGRGDIVDHFDPEFVKMLHGWKV